MSFPIDFPFVSNLSIDGNTSNLDFTSLNRGFPDFRSRTFRKILTLRGSCKTNFSYLRVFESFLGLEENDTFIRWECENAGAEVSRTLS